MIWESFYWKEPLLATARRIDAATRAKVLGDRRLAQIERDVVFGCFSVRKLTHSGPKLTDACRAMRVPLKWFPNSQRVNLFNTHKIDELYELSNGSVESRDLEFVCSRVIHSFVFMIERRAGAGVTGFFFNSDHDRNQRIYRIGAEEIVRIFETVGRDYPMKLSGSRDPDSGDWIIKAD